MNAKEKRASLLAVLAAALYSLTSPFSKILLSDITPNFDGSSAIPWRRCGRTLFL